MEWGQIALLLLSTPCKDIPEVPILRYHSVWNFYSKINGSVFLRYEYLSIFDKSSNSMKGVGV